MAKGIRPDKTVDAAITAAKKAKAVKSGPMPTPLADARFGPRVAKSAFSVEHPGSVQKGVVGQRGDKRNTKYAAASVVGSQLGRRAGYRATGTSGATVSAGQRLHGSLMSMGGEPVTARSALKAGMSVHGAKSGVAGDVLGTAAAVGGYAAYRHRNKSKTVVKSAFGIVHKGPLAAVDDVALAPGKVKAVTGTVHPGRAVPAPASSPRKPLAQKLDAAVAATGGSQT